MTLQIEEGKYYLTRDGRKVGPVYNADGEWSSKDNIAKMIPMWNLKTGAANFTSYGPESDHPEYDLVAEWKDTEDMTEDTPKCWKDMTDEEKGALLLAHHEGKTIEWSGVKNPSGDWCDEDPLFLPNIYYRVKPAPKEPKRETVTLYGGPKNSSWGKQITEDTHKITFNLIDGVPDCDSIKMEEI